MRARCRRRVGVLRAGRDRVPVITLESKVQQQYLYLYTASRKVRVTGQTIQCRHVTQPVQKMRPPLSLPCSCSHAHGVELQDYYCKLASQALAMLPPRSACRPPLQPAPPAQSSCLQPPPRQPCSALLHEGHKAQQPRLRGRVLVLYCSLPQVARRLHSRGGALGAQDVCNGGRRLGGRGRGRRSRRRSAQALAATLGRRLHPEAGRAGGGQPWHVATLAQRDYRGRRRETRGRRRWPAAPRSRHAADCHATGTARPQILLAWYGCPLHAGHARSAPCMQGMHAGSRQEPGGQAARCGGKCARLT